MRFFHIDSEMGLRRSYTNSPVLWNSSITAPWVIVLLLIGETLRATSESSNIVIVEPYYEGVLVPDVCAAMRHTPIRIETIGVPHKVLSRYGKLEQHDEELGLTPKGIRRRIERFLND